MTWFHALVGLVISAFAVVVSTALGAAPTRGTAPPLAPLPVPSGVAVTAPQSQRVAVSHSATFAPPRVDVLPDGMVVISFIASGDLRGLATLTLRPAENGLYSGIWAFMVSHVDNTDPATGLEPPDDHPHPSDDRAPSHASAAPHKDFARLVHRGSLAGAVTNALIVFDADGKLTEIAVPLAVAQGTSEFDGATGSGHATLAGLTLVF